MLSAALYVVSTFVRIICFHNLILTQIVILQNVKITGDNDNLKTYYSLII